MSVHSGQLAARAQTLAEWPERSGRLKPTFLVIGAHKCGTTSLFKYLYGHPNVIKPATKEIHFFDRGYHRGGEWYASRFPRLMPEVALRALRSGDCVTGEASPSYMLHPLVPMRAHAMLPDAKLIAILRNPVDRAYSHWRVASRKKWDSLDFESAIDAEPARMEGHLRAIETDPARVDMDFYYHSYPTRGHYAEQLRRWLNFCPKDRLLVLKSEDMFSKPEHVFSRAVEFLGLPAWNPKEFAVHNQGTGSASSIPDAARMRLEIYFEPLNAKLREEFGSHLNWSA